MPEFEKTFHVLIQYFFGFDHLSSFNIIEWYEEKIKDVPECVTLEKCKKFMEQLKEDEEDSDEEDDENSDD